MAAAATVTTATILTLSLGHGGMCLHEFFLQALYFPADLEYPRSWVAIFVL